MRPIRFIQETLPGSVQKRNFPSLAAAAVKRAVTVGVMAAFSLFVVAGPAHADRWEKFPGRGNRADWEKSWNIVLKQAYPLTQQEKWKEAMPLLERAIKIYPGDSFYHFLLAMGKQKTGNPKGAIPEFEKAMELDPNDDHCPYYLGLLYDEEGQFAKSKPLYRKAVKISPLNSEAWTALALATQEVDGPKKAVEVYNEATKLCPKEIMLWNNLGGTQLALLKNYKEAEAAYRKAVAIDPKNYSPKVGLGEALLRKGSYKEALKVLQECSRMPESKDPERAKALGAMIKEVKKKLAPKPKPKKKVVKPATPGASGTPGTSPAPATTGTTAPPAAPATPSSAPATPQ